MMPEAKVQVLQTEINYMREEVKEIKSDIKDVKNQLLENTNIFTEKIDSLFSKIENKFVKKSDYSHHISIMKRILGVLTSSIVIILGYFIKMFFDKVG